MKNFTVIFKQTWKNNRGIVKKDWKKNKLVCKLEDGALFHLVVPKFPDLKWQHLCCGCKDSTIEITDSSVLSSRSTRKLLSIYPHRAYWPSILGIIDTCAWPGLICARILTQRFLKSFSDLGYSDFCRIYASFFPRFSVNGDFSWSEWFHGSESKHNS